MRFLCAGLLLAALGQSAVALPPPAGTSITAQADATYFEPVAASNEARQSNTVVAIVALDDRVELAPDRQAVLGAGAPISFSHTLQNLGNGPGPYSLSYAPLPGADFLWQTVQVAIDLNGNGQFDAGEPTLSSGDTLTLAIGEQRALLVTGSVPSTALPGQVSALRLIVSNATGTELASVTDTVTVETPPAPPNRINFFDGAQPNAAVPVAAAGQNLNVYVVAAACNADALAIERYALTVVTRLAGDSESGFEMVETAPNSGEFALLGLPTASWPQAAAELNNGVLEVAQNDTATAALPACAQEALTAGILLDPGGVVFDANRNEPIAGASVRLFAIGGAGQLGEPAVSNPDGSNAPSSVITGPDGRFSFPVVSPGVYRIDVVPPNGFAFPSAIPPAQQPAGRNVAVAGSYGAEFTLAVGEFIGFDVPLDQGDLAGLFVEKTARTGTAGIGDVVVYDSARHKRHRRAAHGAVGGR